MPIPRELLKAAFAVLPEKTLRAAAEHNGIRQYKTRNASQLVEALSRGGGTNLMSYCDYLVVPELKKVAKAFGLSTKGLKKNDLSYQVWNYVQEYDRRRIKEEAAKHASSLPTLSVEELIDEAGDLRQSIVELRRTGSGRPVAVWHAERDRRAEGLRPWITLDLRGHPDEALRRDGVLEVSVDDDELVAKAVFRRGQLPIPKKGEQALYGKPASEDPCLEILLAKGSRRLKKWLDDLARLGWNIRDWSDNPEFQLHTLISAYRKHAPSRLYTDPKIVYAQLGGWPCNWPEESAIQQVRQRLVLRTYRCSEPWVEVFQRGGGYQVRLRIT